jgi:pyruvate,water dikinase
MGTGVATKRIHSGQSIRVDGDAGTVTLLDEAGADATVADEAPETASQARKVVFAALAAGALIALIIWRKNRK